MAKQNNNGQTNKQMDEVKSNRTQTKSANNRRGGSKKPDMKYRNDDPRNRSDIPSRNDWRFYTVNEEVAKQVANIPFNVMTGMPLKTSVHRVGNATKLSLEFPCVDSAALNGLIRYISSPGIGSNATTGINMAAVQLYTYIRHANSGAKNYDAADVMMYVLAMRDVYSTYFEIRRALAITQSFFYENRAWPEAILKHMGIDPADAAANFSQYCAQLNILGYKINSFAVPKYFKAFERAAYISSLVFGDSDSIRGQTYTFMKAGYYVWNTTTSEQGTMLKAKSYGPRTIKEMLNILTEQLDALYLDTDAITMSGDILKAFSEGDLYSVQPYAMEKLAPVYDTDILAQIENMTLLGGGAIHNDVEAGQFQLGTFDITQEAQLIKFAPKVPVGDLKYPTTMLFNSHKSDPDYRDVLEWSRLVLTCKEIEMQIETEKIKCIEITSSGLEIPLNFSVCRYDVTTVGATPGSLQLQTQYVEQVVYDTQIFLDFQACLQFDWHPTIYFIPASDGDTNLLSHFICDTKVPTVLPEEIAQRINECAVHAAFYFA